MALNFSSFTSTQQLKQHLQDVFTDNEQEIIFATPLIKQRFIESLESTTIQGRRLLSLDEFIDKYFPQVINQPFKQIPYAEQNKLVLELIITNRNTLPQLADLLEGEANYIADILLLIERIERQIDIDYQDYLARESGNKYEQEIQLVREMLTEQGLLLRSARASVFARQLSNSSLDKQSFVFAPPATFHYQFGGILKGLSEKNTVQQTLLASKTVAEEIITALGCEEYLDNLTSIDNYQPTFNHPIYLTSQHATTAKEIITNWQRQGVADKDILIADNYTDHLFFQLATVLQQEVRGRRSIHFTDNQAAILLKAILDNSLNLEEINNLFNEDQVTPPDMRGDDNFMRLTEDELTALRAALEASSQQQQLELIYTTLVAKSRGKTIDINSFLWLDGLKKLMSNQDQLNLQEYSLLLEKLSSASLLYGGEDNLVLTSYGEAASLQGDKVCCFLRGEQATKLKFVSRKLLQTYPRLEVDNSLLEIKSLASSRQEVVFIATPDDAEENLFFNSHDLTPTDLQSDKPLLADKEIEAASILLNEFTDYSKQELVTDNLSVTSWQAFTDCQLGWAVNRQLKVNNLQHISENRAAYQGTLMHSLLEQLASKSPQQLINEINQQSLDEVKQLAELYPPHLFEFTLVDLIATINSVASLYLNAEKIYVEQELSGRFEVLPELKIKGKIDVILEYPESYLLIDYKKNSPPDKGLQQGIYPTLVNYSQSFNSSAKPVVGFAYIGIAARRATLFCDQYLTDDPVLKEVRESIHISTQSKQKWREKNFAPQAIIPADFALTGKNSLITNVYQMNNLDLRAASRCNKSYCAHNLINTILRKEQENVP